MSQCIMDKIGNLVFWIDWCKN